MKKTHEKSKIESLRTLNELKNIEQSNVILQTEIIQATERYDRLYIVEYITNLDYYSTTLEGRLAEKEEFIIKQENEIEDIKQECIWLKKELENYKNIWEAGSGYIPSSVKERILNGFPPDELASSLGEYAGSVGRGNKWQ